MNHLNIGKYVIIVAGGKGLRMGTEIPKQFLEVGGLPVLMRTILCFTDYDADIKIILVLPHDQQEYWNELCEKYCFDAEYTIVDGGDTRFQSVKNGLSAIPSDEEGLVAVHDGVRPFVSRDVIERCFDEAELNGAVIPVLPVTDTLRDIETGHTVPRANYRAVQTPQVFDLELLKAAYDRPYDENFTDDASVVESFGKEVSLIEGNRENIKLTTLYDLRIAELFVEDFK